MWLRIFIVVARREKARRLETRGRLGTGVPFGAVPHGFRSSYRDWAAERSDAPREVCELALAHVNTNSIEAAYRHTDMFERRRAYDTLGPRLQDARRDIARALGVMHPRGRPRGPERNYGPSR